MSYFLAASMAANKAHIPLTKKTVEKNGIDVVEDKVIKNHFAAEYTYNNYRYTKTFGMIENDSVFMV